MAAATIIQPEHVAVVTGAALGIGRAMCKRFAESGMSVVLADLPGADLDRAVDAVKAVSPRGLDGVLGAPTDVADPEQVQRLRDTVLAKFGKVNVLVNNAAIDLQGSITTGTEDDWVRCFAVNVKGVFLCSRAAVPHLTAAGGGSIVNHASVAGLVGGAVYLNVRSRRREDAHGAFVGDRADQERARQYRAAA